MSDAAIDYDRLAAALAPLVAARLVLLMKEPASAVANDPPTPPTPEPEPKLMKPPRYRATRDIPESTLRDYLAAGLPSRGAGRSRRIPVAEADAWLEQRRGGRG